MRHPPERFQASDPDYAQRVRASFARQKVMAFLGAELGGLAPGWCEIRLPYREELTQQHGYFQAGIVGAIIDDAGGYAGYTLMPAGASVLTVEYKLNLLAPADGQMLIAQGEVIKPGRTLVITRGEVYVIRDSRTIHCASMQQTLITLHGRPDDREIRRKENPS